MNGEGRKDTVVPRIILKKVHRKRLTLIWLRIKRAGFIKDRLIIGIEDTRIIVT